MCLLARWSTLGHLIVVRRILAGSKLAFLEVMDAPENSKWLRRLLTKPALLYRIQLELAVSVNDLIFLQEGVQLQDR